MNPAIIEYTSQDIEHTSQDIAHILQGYRIYITRYWNYITILMIFFCFAPFENNSLKWRPLPLMDCTFWPLYARHSWSLSREGSLACHTYCYTGHPFIWSSQRTLDTQSYCRAFNSGAVTTCFYDLGLSRLAFEHPNFRLRGELSNALLLFHRPGCMV